MALGLFEVLRKILPSVRMRTNIELYGLFKDMTVVHTSNLHPANAMEDTVPTRLVLIVEIIGHLRHGRRCLC